MPPALRLGVSGAAYLRPLTWGLEQEPELFHLHHDVPAKLAYEMTEHTGALQCAFLSPIDYARHGGTFRIVPGLCVASAVPTDTICLYIKPGVRNVGRLAVDIRVTSEIILAKIILMERFPNLPSDHESTRFVPMMPDVAAMLQKGDAALISHVGPPLPAAGEAFRVDLVQEWSDLTGLPYVHGVWVTEEGLFSPNHLEALGAAKRKGLAEQDAIALQLANEGFGSRESCRSYIGAFSYDLGDQERQALEEFIQYAFFYGVLPDAPELNFLEPLPEP